MLQIYSPARAGESPHPALDVVTVRRGDSLWLGIRGELDLTSLPRLDESLSHVDLGGVHQVHLLLQHLAFCDVGGMRQLVGFADLVRRHGGRVTTHGASPMLEKVARLMGADRALALV
jgi:anti-anti-sigma factor